MKWVKDKLQGYWLCKLKYFLCSGMVERVVIGIRNCLNDMAPWTSERTSPSLALEMWAQSLNLCDTCITGLLGLVTNEYNLRFNPEFVQPIGQHVHKLPFLGGESSVQVGLKYMYTLLCFI